MREDWIESSLGEVCKITLGQSPLSTDCNNQKIGLPFFQGKAEFTSKYPIPRVWCAKPKKIANADSILLSVRAPVGSTNVAFEKCGIGRGLAALEYDLCQDFILFYLKAIEQELDSKGTGTTFRAISGDILRNQKIPLPPLPEQRAIVKKLESLFGSLDAGIADLKKAQQQLKIYRQAVLKKAFEGELTKEWRNKQNNLPGNNELLKLINNERENYYQIQLEEWQMAISDWEKNGDSERKPVKPKLSKLLNQITKEEFIDDLFEIPTNWIWDRLENLIFEVKDGTHDTPKYQEKGIPFVTQKNIKNDDITFDNIQFISNLDHQKFFARSNVKRNDIIMAMIGHNRGTCTIVKTDIVFSIKNVALFKFFEQIQVNKYFLYFFQFTGGLEIILKKSKGGAQPFIGLTELRNWPIPYCSFLEQSQIVKQIESRLSVCDSIEQNIKESLEKAEALRQSILKKAFEGNLLTAQELAECKQAADYEPASVLLERIKADKIKKIDYASI
ncbi:restriction endonuclease subunit S [Chryseobacterium caseinilyticum]|uniref:Restriction endonuclease subunit S n=1 Tax=Chryseobacterium caseinilyticum TaxID=2771428 RepID=A0ABR8ZAU2_9FLAO|nr:restriction endonuclease subunit S [Chryseobacterium caseinilyticum]MBD8082353.1 restriction endonuclease subunit S [Chryseobacterium caseinilyticum]